MLKPKIAVFHLEQPEKVNKLGIKLQNFKNKVKIIAGSYKTRVITFEDVPSLRPTSNRIRETLFNWLQHYIQDAFILDVFSGSGAIFFEAISRGATGFALEKHDVAFKSLQKNATNLRINFNESLNILNVDAINFLQEYKSRSFDIIFFDPPFHETKLKEECLYILQHSKFLSNKNTIYYIEDSLQSELKVAFEPLKVKVAGNVKYALYKNNQD